MKPQEYIEVVDKLIEQLEREFSLCQSASSLEKLEDAYTNMLSTWGELNHIMIIVDDEIAEMSDELAASALLDEFEPMWESVGHITSRDLPTFDSSITWKDVLNIFEEYEAYFARYNSAMFLSWDDSNFLIASGDGDVEIIRRPDIMMKDI